MILSLNGKIRTGIIINLLLIIAGCGAGLVWNNFIRPSEVTEKEKVYSYQHAATIDYQVNLLPNNFFTETTLGPGQAYITSLADSLQTQLEYDFFGEAPAEITGTYQVAGALVAYSTVGSDKEMEVWRRNLPFLGSQTFAANDNKIQIQDNILIPVNSYVMFAEAMQEATKFYPSRLELQVDYLIKVQGKTGTGSFTDELHPTLIIPLQGKVFTVQGNLSPNKEGAIEVETTRPVEGIRTVNIGLGTTLLLAALLCIGMLALTRSSDKHLSPEDKKVAQILRQHGERVVTLTSSLPATKVDQILLVNDFEDLVKAADEIEQPILYEIDERQRKHSFYVVSNPYIYRYELVCPPVEQRIINEVGTDSAPSL